MKTRIFYLTLTLLSLSIYAQRPEFRNFQILDDYEVWIVPLDIEQKFNVFQQEVIEKNLEVGVSTLSTRRETPQTHRLDSIHPLAPWLRADRLDSKVAEPYPQKWLQAIPSALTEQLKKGAKEKFAKSDKYLSPYFTVYALVNNKGEVLSVYFKVDSLLTHLVREEDLQTIYDAIMGVSFAPDHFNFHYRNKNVVEEVSRTLFDDPDIEQKMSREEIKALGDKAMARTRPCVYGIVECFCMKYDVIPSRSKNPSGKRQFAP